MGDLRLLAVPSVLAMTAVLAEARVDSVSFVFMVCDVSGGFIASHGEWAYLTAILANDIFTQG